MFYFCWPSVWAKQCRFCCIGEGLGFVQNEHVTFTVDRMCLATVDETVDFIDPKVSPTVFIPFNV